MVTYQCTYIIGCAIVLSVWLFFFIRRKDTRKEMLILSTIFGIICILLAPITTQDWGQPLTITKTSSAGIEDFLFGFGTGGIAAVAYSHLFNKRTKLKKAQKIIREKRNLNLWFLILLFLVIFLGSFAIFRINSLLSFIPASVIPTIIIWVKRKDLIKNSLLSGLILTALSIPGYYLLNSITPEFIEQFWDFENIGRIMLLGIPIEEYIFYFGWGMFIGPLYEYWKEGKLINIKN